MRLLCIPSCCFPCLQRRKECEPLLLEKKYHRSLEYEQRIDENITEDERLVLLSMGERRNSPYHAIGGNSINESPKKRNNRTKKSKKNDSKRGKKNTGVRKAETSGKASDQSIVTRPEANLGDAFSTGTNKSDEQPQKSPRMRRESIRIPSNSSTAPTNGDEQGRDTTTSANEASKQISGYSQRMSEKLNGTLESSMLSISVGSPMRSTFLSNFQKSPHLSENQIIESTLLGWMEYDQEDRNAILHEIVLTSHINHLNFSSVRSSLFYFNSFYG